MLTLKDQYIAQFSTGIAGDLSSTYLSSKRKRIFENSHLSFGI